MGISVVILTKNEEINIERCLKSVSFCNEIIVIDDFSQDKTTEIAKQFGVKIFRRKLQGDFAGQRNFGMSKVRNDWVLFVDADEQVSKKLKPEILRLTSFAQDDRQVAYRIKRRDYWWGRELKFGEARKIRQTGLIRLVKKDSGRWVGRVHEIFLTSGGVGQLKSFLNHYPHNTLADFIKEVNFYSTLRAKELLRQNKHSGILEIIFYPMGKFLLNYFFYLGFLDGPSGFTYAFMMSFHSFLVRAKLYQYNNIDRK